MFHHFSPLKPSSVRSQPPDQSESSSPCHVLLLRLSPGNSLRRTAGASCLVGSVHLVHTASIQLSVFHELTFTYTQPDVVSNTFLATDKTSLFNLGGADESEPGLNNDLCLATNKNWPRHLFCIWRPIMCKLKGETPQEGINRRQSGDRARHGGQMAERRSGFSVFGCRWVGAPWIPD